MKAFYFRERDLDSLFISELTRLLARVIIRTIPVRGLCGDWLTGLNLKTRGCRNEFEQL